MYNTTYVQQFHINFFSHSHRRRFADGRFGRTRANFRHNTYKTNYTHNCYLLAKHLLACGWEWATLAPLFEERRRRYTVSVPIVESKFLKRQAGIGTDSVQYFYRVEILILILLKYLKTIVNAWNKYNTVPLSKILIIPFILQY